MGWWPWLLYWTGGRWPSSAPTVQYNELSGFLSIVIPPVLQVLAVIALFWWHNQCHVHHCWWYARRTTAAGERACWKHHPRKRRTAADIREAHEAATREAA